MKQKCSQQQQEKGESGKKPSTTPKAIRIATISKLLEKQTTQMDKIGRMVQPLQKQLISVERRTEFIKQMPSQLKQLQKQMLQVQKESQKIGILLSKKKTASTKKKNTKKKNTKKKNTKKKNTKKKNTKKEEVDTSKERSPTYYRLSLSQLDAYGTVDTIFYRLDRLPS